MKFRLGKKQYRKLVTLISERLSVLNDLLTTIDSETDAYTSLRDISVLVNEIWEAAQTKLAERDPTQESCVAMAEAAQVWHDNAFAYDRLIATESTQSYARGTDYIHADLFWLIPIGGGEGDKCWPPC